MPDSRSDMGTVSVIIVNFNSGTLLAHCVASALCSTVPVEVLVSDNASTDQSVAFLRRYCGGDPRLHIFENEANLGFARANNMVLPKAGGGYVLFLNPDCIIQPDTLEQMVAAMEAYPLAGMAGCLIRNPDGTEQAGCRRFVPTPWRALVRVLKLSRIFHSHPRFSSFVLTGQPLPRHPTPVEAISGAFMFVRRSALDYVGPLDEGYFLHCEDLDWCMRFRQSGFAILFVPDVEIMHAKGIGSAGHPVYVEWHKHKGMIRFYHKFFRRQYPFLLLLAVTLAVWARFCAIAAKVSFQSLFSALASEDPRGAMPDLLAVTARRVSFRPGIIVTGATSQIGHFLIPRLREAGYAVHAVSRQFPLAGAVADDAEFWHRIDIARDTDALSGIIGATALIHLAPLATLPNLIDIAARTGVRRILAFGSTSRYSKLASADQQEQRWVTELIESEAALEAKCAANGITWTVFRPTLIYGCGMDKNVTTIANFIHRFGFFPIAGEGKGLRRPVHADDLAAACLKALDCPATFNRAYNLSGGEALTYRQMVEAIFQGLGKKPRILRFPVAAFAVLLKAAVLFPAYRHLNPEMVNRISLDMNFDHLEATRDFGYSPRKFRFSSYAGRYPHEHRHAPIT
jgi:GT2 family glycosyltransferase/nucleoside-diphosphate-sugar epimerase